MWSIVRLVGGLIKSFFRIPSEKDREKRQKWLLAIRRFNPDAPKPGFLTLLIEFVRLILFMVGLSLSDYVFIED